MTDLPIRVAGHPEPDGTQPMSPAELRMVRDYLGLTAEDLAGILGVNLRTVQRWEHRHATVPDGVRQEVERLEAEAAGHVDAVVVALGDAADLVLTIPTEPAGGRPAGWWRMVAMRACQEVPGVHVRYD